MTLRSLGEDAPGATVPVHSDVVPCVYPTKIHFAVKIKERLTRRNLIYQSAVNALSPQKPDAPAAKRRRSNPPEPRSTGPR